MRALYLTPKRLARTEWQHSQDYATDRKSFRCIDLDALEFVFDRLVTVRD
jgi:hypothetical protein